MAAPRPCCAKQDAKDLGLIDDIAPKEGLLVSGLLRCPSACLVGWKLMLRSA